MAVPEAALDENGEPTRRKHEVGRPRQTAQVEPVAAAGGMDRPAQAEFGRVFLCRTARIIFERVSELSVANAGSPCYRSRRRRTFLL